MHRDNIRGGNFSPLPPSGGESDPQGISGTAIGWTALNAELAWTYIPMLLEARKKKEDYEALKAQDIERLFDIKGTYRYIGIVADASARANGFALTGQPFSHKLEISVRGGPTQLVDYTPNGAGMINGAASYVVLHWLPLTRNTIFSFTAQDVDVGQALMEPNGRYQLPNEWFDQGPYTVDGFPPLPPPTTPRH